MSKEEYKQSYLKVHSKKRKSRCEKYKSEILLALEEFPGFSSAQIFDQLERKYGPELDVSERTIRHYVSNLREEYGIPKPKKKRDYLAVREIETGRQAQVDYGETSVRLAKDKAKRKKLYFFCMVLYHSRYKFVCWQTRPFTTEDIIKAHEQAFEYFQGEPEEIVYDQDSTIVVAENSGEIIYTQAFENYLQARAFKPYVCRGADPESKGKVENVVKYVKNNFSKGKLFRGIEEWNQDCFAWLERRANGKIHQTTKKIPAEVFADEKKHLLPHETKPYSVSAPIISYNVRKDNTVELGSNRYELPRGTYNKIKRVGVQIYDEQIVITNPKNGTIIQIHKISEGKGQLITIPENERSVISVKAKQLCRQVEELFDNIPEARQFTAKICREFPRYAHDQFDSIISTIHFYDANPEVIIPALKICVDAQRETAQNFKYSCRHYAACAGIAVDEPEEFAQNKALCEYRREEEVRLQLSKEQRELQAYQLNEYHMRKYRQPLEPDEVADIDIYADYRGEALANSVEETPDLIELEEDIYADYR